MGDLNPHKTGLLKRRVLYRWRNWPLAIKLAVLMSSLVVGAVAIVSVGFMFREQRVARDEMGEQAKAILSSIAVASSDAIYFSDTNKLSDIAGRLNEMPNLEDVRFYDGAGRLIGQEQPENDTQAARPFEPDPWGMILVRSDDHVFSWGEDRLVAGQALFIGDVPQGAISVSISTNALSARLAAIRYQGIGVASIAAILAALLCILVSRSVTLPLKELAEATGKIGMGEFEYRSSINQRDEVGVLSRSFADMTERLFQFRKGLEQRTEELSRTADELRNSTVSINYLDNIMGSMADSLIVVGPDFTIRKANPAACKLLGYTEDELIGMGFGSILADDDFEDDLVYQVLVQGLTNKVEGGYVSKNGVVTPVEFSSSRMLGENGEIEGTVCVAQDITQRRRDHQALVNARQQALEAPKAKSEFLASISHEIRTPMNAIIGMTHALSTTNLSPEQKEYVQLFQSAGSSLLALINDILDISKIEAGKLILEETTVDVGELVGETVQIMALEAHQKGLELCVDVSGDVPSKLIGDPTRLRQIIINLVGNALKFTNTGEILLRVQADPGGESPGSLFFSISDTGVGIPPEKIDLIFGTFNQADSSITREYGGTGLGLSICQRLVALMGGQIWVDSQVDKGSTFYFNVRLTATDGSTSEETSTYRTLEGHRILVLEPNLTNRNIVQSSLAGWGADTFETAQFGAGLAELQQAKTLGRPYDLVVLNRHVPNTDSFDLARLILTENDRTKVLMMLTTENQSEDIARCDELGISDYIIKPIRKPPLLGAVSQALGCESAPTEAITLQTHEVNVDQRPLRILLVEDYKNNQLVIQAYLGDTPYEVDIAENGQMAVERSGNESYDLILMDLQMPVMDGFTATRMIREREADLGSSPIPIIALSANAESENINQCTEAGFDAYISKPIDQAKLLKTIQTCTGGVLV